MLETNQMTITDENGIEREVQILLTFESDAGKSFVLFVDSKDPEENVYAYHYDEDGNLDEVTDEEEWEMCQEVLGAFQAEDEIDA